MRALDALVTRAAQSKLPVLVRGETGSGKELVVRTLHARSARASGPFKTLSCATIPAELLERALFGSERGGQTTQGIFEQVHGGTLFVDELGELTPRAQAALLRVLERLRVVRVGGTREIEVDARVVAATHRDLRVMVAAGTFREDLLFRLEVITLSVPPLRERSEELTALAEHFLRGAREQWCARPLRFSPDVLQALTRYPWPGNVRQLRNVVEHAATVCDKETIELCDLPPPLRDDASPRAPEPALPCLRDRVRAFEIELIREALARADGSQSEAARMLGVPRRTLAHKVQMYGLQKPPR